MNRSELNKKIGKHLLDSFQDDMTHIYVGRVILTAI